MYTLYSVSAIYNNQDLETTLVPSNRWVNKMQYIESTSTTLYSGIRKDSLAFCYNMGGIGGCESTKKSHAQDINKQNKGKDNVKWNKSLDSDDKTEAP